MIWAWICDFTDDSRIEPDPPEGSNLIVCFRFHNIDTQCKLNYKIVQSLFNFVNASMEIVWERAWGEATGKNTYTGLLGRLQRKEIHLGGIPEMTLRTYFI